MIQFNLLPQVKMDYVKAKHSKQMIVVIAAIVAAGCLAILVFLFLVVDGVQKKHLSDVNKDITTYTKQLQGTNNLDKILTIQNQLDSLPSLHAKKPVSSRLFGFMGQITPAQANISALTVDFDLHTIQITGTADNLTTINTFVDTLKFTTYTTNGDPKTPNAFSKVVLSSFSIGAKNTTYTINLSLDPAIFDSANTVVLTVPPGKITTRSETQKPTDLFKQPTTQ